MYKYMSLRGMKVHQHIHITYHQIVQRFFKAGRRKKENKYQKEKLERSFPLFLIIYSKV